MFKNLFEKNNGCFCWISVSRFNGGISEVYKVDGLKKGDILTGKISYPLDFGKSVEISLAWDENRFKLCEGICKMYKKIYETEKEMPGTYGIWGHRIEDLVIEQIQVDPVNKTFSLYIGS